MRGRLISVLALLVFATWVNAGLVDGLVGLWEFNDPSNLTKATIGNDLELVGTASAIEGYAPGDGAVSIDVGSYFKVDHGIAPNPPGAQWVNIWSLLVDLKYPEVEWHAIYQCNQQNANDAECFIKPTNQIGVGATGYSSNTMSPETWYRVVISIDNSTHYKIFVNGELWLSAPGQGIDSRFSIDPLLLLFADNDGEDNEIHVSNVALWSRALSDDEAAALGGVGNPIPEPATVLLAVLGLGFIRRR